MSRYFKGTSKDFGKLKYVNPVREQELGRGALSNVLLSTPSVVWKSPVETDATSRWL